MAHPAAIAIRREGPADKPAIARLHRAAFPTPLEADLVGALRDGAELLASLVVVDAGAIIGHVALSPAAVIGAETAAKVAWLAFGAVPLAGTLTEPEAFSALARARGPGDHSHHASLQAHHRI
jgi:predicted N-acetyltransferase YhbS